MSTKLPANSSQPQASELASSKLQGMSYEPQASELASAKPQATSAKPQASELASTKLQANSSKLASSQLASSPAPSSLAQRSQLASSPLASSFQSEVIAVFVDLMQLLGLPKSYGELYGLLYASAQPLSFAEIEQKLTLSKGSISQGLKALRQLGAVQTTPAPDGVAARELYKPQIELRQLIGLLLRERLVPYIQGASAHLEAIDAALETHEATEAEAQTLSARVEKLKTWQKRTSLVLPAVAKLIG